jgi:hypothetical protein
MDQQRSSHPLERFDPVEFTLQTVLWVGVFVIAAVTVFSY